MTLAVTHRFRRRGRGKERGLVPDLDRRLPGNLEVTPSSWAFNKGVSRKEISRPMEMPMSARRKP
jgi:hypothetical protein